ncbi:hypothetical protein WJX75_000660 [Coccomyxa subellipsoidea]|uniref:Uncharacterized protein n=1 Tax=Coccomyxa subellipsoidea TaxID=248742 RepID=A0ABR2YYX6_9CHLO
MSQPGRSFTEQVPPPHSGSPAFSLISPPLTSPSLTSPPLTPPSLTLPSPTSPSLTSPFEITLQKAASSGLDDSVEPLTKLARRLSLEADLYSRQRVNARWRSLSIGEPDH